MRMITITHQRLGLGERVACAYPEHYGPFADVGSAETRLEEKRWVKVIEGDDVGQWVVQRSATRFLYAKITLLELTDEAKCLEPSQLPDGEACHH